MTTTSGAAQASGPSDNVYGHLFRLYVVGLPPDMTEAELQALFNEVCTEGQGKGPDVAASLGPAMV